MKQIFIKKENNPHLILFFAGWGSDENLFGRECNKDCDYMLCYDYKDLEFDTSEISVYKEITIIGWSMGVWVGQEVLNKYITTVNDKSMLYIGNSAISIKSSIAVNGTTWPISDSRGIPANIFKGTLDNFSGTVLARFRRRICGTAENSKEFISHNPYRGIEDLGQELDALWNMVACKDTETRDMKDCRAGNLWTGAVVGTNDKIFPKNNQTAAWHEYGMNENNVMMMDIEHYDSRVLNSLLENLSI